MFADETFNELASKLGQNGREFNSRTLEQFKNWYPESSIKEWFGLERGQLRLLQCAAHALGWLQPDVHGDEEGVKALVRFYYSLMLLVREERAKKKISDLMLDAFVIDEISKRINRLKPRSERSRRSKNPPKPARTQGIIAGLITWTKLDPPEVDRSGSMSLREIQARLFETNKRVGWTMVAPVKLYALDRPGLSQEWPERPDPGTGEKECYLPIGQSVSRAIRHIFGIHFGESEKDHKNAQQLQVRIKEWANERLSENSARYSVLDINSGLQAFKSVN